MGRHDQVDGDGNPVTGTGERFRLGGRHSRDVPDRPTDAIPRIDPIDPEAATDRILIHALYWLDGPADGSWTLADTQPIPTPAAPPTGQDAQQADREGGQHVQPPGMPAVINPHDPQHLALVLAKLQRWTPNPKNSQIPKE